MPKGGVFVLDCLGKFNMHRFMNILHRFKTHHSVLFDGDGGNPPHDSIKQLIESASNDYTKKIDTFEDDLEGFLGIQKSKNKYRKPQHVMLNLIEDRIPDERLTAFVKKVSSLIN